MAGARRFLAPLVFFACLLPLGVLVAQALTDRLGANPIEAVLHRTGLWTLRLLLLTLAITPLRRVTGLAAIAGLRRMVGLFAFFWAGLHLSAYLFLDRFFDLATVGEDVAKRPYITVGFTAFLLLLLLAVTSTRRWKIRLGRHWRTLHRLVYAAGVLGVVHFLWLVKADLREPLVYGALLGVLLGFRVVDRLRSSARRRRAAFLGALQR